MVSTQQGQVTGQSGAFRCPFPSKQTFEAVCQHGLGQLRPLHASVRSEDDRLWNFGSAGPPSYGAYGRLRAVLALTQARQLRPRRVLEVAAGDAALSACLEAQGCEVVANDLRSETLTASTAKYLNQTRIRLAPGNVFDLQPAELGLFDLVVACELIEHVAHAPELLKQLKRFLTPDGKILITTPNGAYFRSKLLTYSQIVDFDSLETLQFRPDADGHLYLITPSEMEDIARQAGLVVRSMFVWGTPFVYGDCGLRHLSWMLPSTWWYSLEMICQRFGARFLTRFGNSLSIVLESREQ
jgi:2-polyprenyl-3-methyl-5-hydroxy-6-metoxy-1,4-benzoquinol methylase